MGERNRRKLVSSWVGVVHGAETPIWRVVAYTHETPSSKIEEHWFAQFGSSHRASTNFVFVDGSVRPVYDTIDEDTFRAMGTIRRQDKIANNDY